MAHCVHKGKKTTLHACAGVCAGDRVRVRMHVCARVPVCERMPSCSPQRAGPHLTPDSEMRRKRPRSLLPAEKWKTWNVQGLTTQRFTKGAEEGRAERKVSDGSAAKGSKEGSAKGQQRLLMQQQRSDKGSGAAAKRGQTVRWRCASTECSALSDAPLCSEALCCLSATDLVLNRKLLVSRLATARRRCDGIARAREARHTS